MNIVLIGATGAIGSRILDEALRRGHRVTGLTRDPDLVQERGRSNRAGVEAIGEVAQGVVPRKKELIRR